MSIERLINLIVSVPNTESAPKPKPVPLEPEKLTPFQQSLMNAEFEAKTNFTKAKLGK